MTKQSKDLDAIKQLAEDWRSGRLVGDADALLSLYADDPVHLMGQQRITLGKEEMKPFQKIIAKLPSL